MDSRKESGGAYQELIYTLRNIKKLNKDNIKFVTISVSKNLKLEKENFEHYYFKLNAFDRYIAYLRNFNSLIRGVKKYFFFPNKFENFLKKNNIDLVYFIGPSQYSLYLEKTKFFMTVPDVGHRENLEFPEIVDSSEFQRKHDIFKKSLPRALAVITNCKIIKEKISFFYGLLKERIFLINHQPSSIIEEFKEINENKLIEFRNKFKLPLNYIFYPATYSPHKNHRVLIDSLKILKKNSNLNLKMVFCGDDIGYLANLKKYVKSHDLENEIIFLKFVDDEYLPYLYLDSSTLVMPSLLGPTNIPPWEAFKMNKPVIYSDLPGIRDVLGDAVFYINPMEPENIVSAIKKIHSDESLKNKLVLKGKEKLKENYLNSSFNNFFKIIKNYRNIQKTWNL